MLFEVVVVIVLAILVVNQFDLWTRFKDWYNRQVSVDSVVSNRNYKVYIFIVLVAVVFSLVISFIQSSREINLTASTLALQQLAFNAEGISESALHAQREVFKSSLDFSALYWAKFFENTAFFILIPILISMALVFINDEMQRTKKELEKVAEAVEEPVEESSETVESSEELESELVDPVNVSEVEDVWVEEATEDSNIDSNEDQTQ